MDFIIGTSVVILLIVAIGFFSSGKFASLADTKGYVAIKAKRYPWVIAAVTFALMLLGQTVLSFFASVEFLLAWSLFTVVLMITVLRKAYKNMQAAPNRGELAEMLEEEEAVIESE